MKKGDYHSAIGKSYNKVERLLPVIAADFNPKKIHEIRVEVKKLKALFRLIKSGHYKGKKPGIPAALKKIYRHLGEIRNLQLHLGQLEAYGKENTMPEAYHSLLLSELEREKKMAAEQLGSGAPPLLSEEHRNGRTKVDLSRSDIRRYYAQKREAILQAVKGDRSFGNIHQLRKILKDLQYNKDPLRDGLRHFQYHRIQAMAKLIGRYIDSWNSLHFVTHYGHLLGPAEMEKTREWHDVLAQEKATALRQFKEALPVFEKSFLSAGRR